MKHKLMITMVGALAVFSMQAHAQMLVVNPTVLDADWETGYWTSGYAEFTQARANFQLKKDGGSGLDLSEDYADRKDFLTFYATNEFARSGDYSVKFYSNPQPSGDDQPYRTEIAYFGSLTFDVGDELYYSASYRPGANWGTGPKTWTTVISQWKIAGGGRPAFSLGMSNDGNHNISLARAYYNGGSVEVDYTPLGALPLEEWSDFIFYFKWSTSSDGVAKIWKNGVLIYDYTGITWYQSHLTLGYLQLGMYTQLEWGERTMHIDNVRIGNSMFTNQLPAFVTDPINGADAEADVAYTGSIAGSATDPEGSVTYAKVSGPAWLNVAANGTLSGTPDSGDVGLNVFTVRAADTDFGEDTATLNINVSSSHQITVASDDFQSGTWSGGTGWDSAWDVTTGSGQPELVLLSGNYSVKITSGSSSHSIKRTLASPVSDGRLTFKWDVDSLDNSSEYAYAEVFDGAWHTVWSMNNSGNGSDAKPTPDNLQEASVDLSAYGTVTQIRFSMSSNTSGNDYFYVDDVELHILVDAAYDTWRLGYGLSGADAAFLADPDGDGLDNLGEYALGGYPDQAGLPAGILPGHHIDFSGGDPEMYLLYRRRRDAATRGLSYYLDLTGNLDGGTWSTNGYTETGTQVIDTDFELVANWIPDAVSNGFIRLNIEID